MSTTIDPTTPKHSNPELRPTRMAAALLSGLAREADRRRDRQLRDVYVETLGRLAELHIARLRGRLP